MQILPSLLPLLAEASLCKNPFSTVFMVFFYAGLMKSSKIVSLKLVYETVALNNHVCSKGRWM